MQKSSQGRGSACLGDTVKQLPESVCQLEKEESSDDVFAGDLFD